jgi:hypothetical protein
MVSVNTTLQNKVEVAGAETFTRSHPGFSIHLTRTWNHAVSQLEAPYMYVCALSFECSAFFGSFDG